MNEEKTELNKALSPEARDKLSDITARIKMTRESIDRITKQEKKTSMVRRLLVSMITIPILFALFIGAMYLGLWMIMYPLDTSQISGISIFLIGCYTIFIRGK